jgi:hypothetical protein
MGVTVFAHDDGEVSSPETARRRHEEYLDRIRGMDFRRTPCLPRYFVLPFFNDGTFERFEYDPHQHLLVLQMESVETLNDVYDLRERLGMPRMMDHRCEDFSYTCTFKGVLYLQIRRMPMRITTAQGEELRQIPLVKLEDSYQHGEILDSELRRELEVQSGLKLHHLRFYTGWAKEVDVVFEKVTVQKLTDVKYESFTGGKRVRLSKLFRG